MAESRAYERQKELKEVAARNCSYRSLLEEKELEVARLKRDMAALEEQNFKVSKERRMMEEDLGRAHEERRAAEREAAEFASRAQLLSSDHSLVSSRTRAAESAAESLRNDLHSALSHLEAVRRENTQLDARLAAACGQGSSAKDRGTQMAVANGRLDGDVRGKEQRVEKLRFQLQRSRKVQDELVVFLDSLQKELARVRAGIGVPKVSCIEAGERLKELREENETLQRLLDQYRKDINFQKNLREIEATRRRELELERQELQRETRTKDFEVLSTKQALANARDKTELLLEDKVQIDEELNALRQHAEVLKSQNVELNSELERFVETDEVVKRDLNRKPRLDYIKDRNYDELSRSAAKVRQSASPRRSAYS